MLFERVAEAQRLAAREMREIPTHKGGGAGGGPRKRRGDDAGDEPRAKPRGGAKNFKNRRRH